MRFRNRSVETGLQARDLRLGLGRASGNVRTLILRQVRSRQLSLQLRVLACLEPKLPGRIVGARNFLALVDERAGIVTKLGKRVSTKRDQDQYDDGHGLESIKQCASRGNGYGSDDKQDDQFGGVHILIVQASRVTMQFPIAMGTSLYHCLMIRARYDQEADCLYVHFGSDRPIMRTLPVDGERGLRFVDLDVDDRPIGLEIIGVSAHELDLSQLRRFGIDVDSSALLACVAIARLSRQR